jgi:hypothetical protein
MFLSAVLFVLFLAGCWLYCLTDAALTPAAEFTGLRKPVWIAVIAATFILGSTAWVIVRWSRRTRRRRAAAAGHAITGFDPRHVRRHPDHPATTPGGLSAAEALARHPASRPGNRTGPGVPIGPDDDPEFLRMLDRLISGTSDQGELSPVLTVSLHERRLAARRPTRPEKVRTWVQLFEPGPLASSWPPHWPRAG